MGSLNVRSAPREGYWKPILEDEPSLECTQGGESTGAILIAEERPSVKPAEARTDVCQHCGTEFVLQSQFCRMCGRRVESSVTNDGRFASRLDFNVLRRKLGLTVAGLVCFLAGVLCLGAAVSVSFIFDANNLVDWQAVQIWRIEWLLAAIGTFLAGILLNRRAQ